MPYVFVLSALPSLIHMFAATGVLSDWKYPDAQRDSLEWWIDATVDCYRLGPNTGQYKNLLAYLQLLAAIVTLIIHLSKMFNFRPIIYYLFLVLYVVTQLRHLVFGYGVNVIGYLFTHILIYTIQVMYYETRIRKLKL